MGSSEDSEDLAGLGPLLEAPTSCFFFLACSFVSPLGWVGTWNGGGDVNDSDESEESEEILMILGLDFMVASKCGVMEI